MMIFLEMYIRFFLVGLFAVGGGLATLPFLADMAETTGWFTQADISNMVAISESTPGPLGINMATYVGFQTGSQFGIVGGLVGAVIAPMGVITPSIIVILIVAKVLMKFRSSKYVEYVFYGLRAASLGLVAAAFLGVAELAFYSGEVFAETGDIFAAVNYKSIILSVLIFILIKKFKKLHPVSVVLLSAVIGMVFKF